MQKQENHCDTRSFRVSDATLELMRKAREKLNKKTGINHEWNSYLNITARDLLER
tara:strand:- start:239 stop:403 length:165 start_codon:yes stop_codon:yes gene_type:complete